MNATKLTAQHEPQGKGAKKSKKPKRNISAFHIFSKEMHAQLNESHDKINPNKRMSMISEMWANLPAPEKNIYNEKAKLDKWRYLNELNEFYSKETEIAPMVSTKAKPKKFGNAFTFFLREQKQKLREGQPHLLMSDIMSMVAKDWRELSKAEKQKYVDASEEDKKRYKKEVCEMAQKSKPKKIRNKKRLLKNVQNFEKTFHELTQHTNENQEGNKNLLSKQDSSPSKQGKPLKIETSFRFSRTGSSRQNSYSEWMPKIEARDRSFEHITFPKLEYGENLVEKNTSQENGKLQNNASYKRNLFNRNDSYEFLNFGLRNNQSFLKNMDSLPNLPSFNSGYQVSLPNLNMSNNANTSNSQTGINEEPKPTKGRNYLNGILSNALNTDHAISMNDLLIGMDPSLSVEKSIDKDFFANQPSMREDRFE